jgi:5'-3' exonuclease
MGAKGLFQFLKRFQREIHISDYVANKSVGIDIFWFLHKSKGSLFILKNWLRPIINTAYKTHCVFDGIAPPEKTAQLEAAAKKRTELVKSITDIEAYLKYPFNHIKADDRRHIQAYLEDLKHQAWQPTPEFIRQVKEFLEEKGCIIHQAPMEADEYLYELQEKGNITAIITNDSDLLLLGSTVVIRPLSPTTGALFVVSDIQNSLGFKEHQWGDFMHLCRLMNEKDIILAYSLISVYKELDYAVQRYEILYEKNLI